MPKSLLGARNRSVHVRNLGRRNELSHRRIPKRTRQWRRTKLLRRCRRVVPAPMVAAQGLEPERKVEAVPQDVHPVTDNTPSEPPSAMMTTTDTMTTTQLVEQLRGFAVTQHWLPSSSRTKSMTVLTRLVDVALQRRQLCIADLCAHLQHANRPLGAMAEQWLETRRTMASLTHFVYTLGRPLDLVLRLDDGQSIVICRLVRVCPYTANLKIRDILWLVGAETDDNGVWSKRVTLDRFHTSIMSLLAQRLAPRSLCALVLGYAYEDALAPMSAPAAAAPVHAHCGDLPVCDDAHALAEADAAAATHAWVMVPDDNSPAFVAASASVSPATPTPVAPSVSASLPPDNRVNELASAPLADRDSWWNWLGLSRIW